MKIANRATFSKKRPQAAPTVTDPGLLEDGSDLAFREMVHDALAFSSRLEAVRSGFARLIGLTGIQYTILISISHLQYEQDVSISTIATHLHLSGAFVTNETNKLTAEGLVEKFQDPDDRRRVILRTTPEAQAKLARLAAVQSQVNNEHFAPLAHGDFQTFKRLISELVDSTDRALALLTALGPRVREKANQATASVPSAKKSPSSRRPT